MNSYIMPDKDLRGYSVNWANWMSKLAWNTCLDCFKKHGSIYSISILPNYEELPVNEHYRCQCLYVPMRTKTLGTVTKIGYNGADAFLYYIHDLPSYYIGKDIARRSGWRSKKGNLADILPGKTIGGDIYYNDDGKLPTAVGRVWYEADINYTGGYRNDERIVYSNDGLMFATYDHFATFYEIIK